MMIFDNTPNVLPHVNAGKVKAIAVTSLKRSELAPTVPTVDEAGVKGFEVNVWFGVVAHASTPRDIVNRLNAEINKTLVSPEVSKRMAESDAIPIGGTPEFAADFVRRETEQWGKVVKTAGIKPQ